MKPTRATLVSDPFVNGSGRWLAFTHIDGKLVSVVMQEAAAEKYKRGSQVNARYEAGEWRVG